MNWKIKLLYLCIFSILCLTTPNTQALDLPDHTNSIIIGSVNGDIHHIQVDTTSSRKIWSTRHGSTVYDYIKVADLNNDEQREIIGIDDNVGIDIIDFETGELLHTFSLISNRASITDVKIGNVMGDSGKEIVLTHKVPLTHEWVSTYVISPNENIMTIINQSILPASDWGGDNIELLNIDEDPLLEVAISYGSTLWNTSSKTGKYAIEFWDFEDNEWKLDNVVEGPDVGGNTKSINFRIDNQEYIVTSGWYNNPIRVFNKSGDLIWEKQIERISTDTTNFADKEIEFYTDETGKNHLFVSQNAYFGNDHELYFYDLNPLTGENIRPPVSMGNITKLNLDINGDSVFFKFKQLSEGASREKFQIFDLSTNKFLEMRNEISFYKLVETNLMNKFTISVGDNRYLLLQDEDLTYYMANHEEKIRISRNLFGNRISVQIFQDHNQVLDGELLTQYADDSEVNSLTYGILMILIITMIVFMGRRYEEWKFDFSFGKNWAYFFFVRLERILLKQSDEMLNHAIIDKIDLPADYEGIVSLDEAIPDFKSIYQELLIPREDGKQIYEFIQTNSEYANQIKIGDLSILIDIFDHYPDSLNLNEIYSKYDYASKTTIYNRVQKMVELDMIDKSDNRGLRDDMRIKSVSITEFGLEFIEILYRSLYLLYNDV